MWWTFLQAQAFLSITHTVTHTLKERLLDSCKIDISVILYKKMDHLEGMSPI